ncbi:hypothetical protein AB5J72_01100 [Streptomyces sp. CG1]|uniref:hypothetical protein n=1 Tax=Streptomyces sp. CG1 TaxID=1287523 RepID=UPI0034E274DB
MQAAVILVTTATEPAVVRMAATIVMYAVETDGLPVRGQDGPGRVGPSRPAKWPSRGAVGGEESASGECRRASSPLPA